MRIEYVEAVLAVVELVPSGTAVAYGDVAELLGSGGPRQVGYLSAGDGRWRVDLAAARWTPGEDKLDRIDAIAEQLERRLHRLSVADDGMSV